MSLRERELAWQRRRRFPAWDRVGGPGRLARWAYRHPVATTSLFVLLLVAPLTLVSLMAEGRGLRVPVVPLIAAGFLYWNLRVAAQLHREWCERPGNPPPSEASTGSWLERADASQQAQTEAENAFGPEEMSSPATNRFFVVWFVYVGLGAVVGIAVTILGSLTG